MPFGQGFREGALWRRDPSITIVACSRRFLRIFFAHESTEDMEIEMRNKATDEPRRLPTNLSLSERLVTEAKQLDINLSRAAEQGLAAAVATERARRWKEENRAAIEAQNAWVAEHGLPLAKYRMF